MRSRSNRPRTTIAAGTIINTRATWYGPGFHGRRTASGERFNQNAMTLASRHLPFGTRVRVVNPKNGRAAIARVNDRGPFGSRSITADLSKGLARRIGLSGTGPVRLEILPRPGARPKPQVAKSQPETPPTAVAEGAAAEQPAAVAETTAAAAEMPSAPAPADRK